MLRLCDDGKARDYLAPTHVYVTSEDGRQVGCLVSTEVQDDLLGEVDTLLRRLERHLRKMGKGRWHGRAAQACVTFELVDYER